MTRKKKPTSSGVSTSAKMQVLSVLKALGTDANLRKLFPKLLKKMGQRDIVAGLHELELDGIIKVGQKGKISLLTASTAKDGRHPARLQRTLVGIIDLTRSGAAYVSVEGMKQDVFIPPKAVHHALQGDEVRLYLTRFGKEPAGEVIEIVRRAQDSFTGHLEVFDKFAFFIADERKLRDDVFIPLSSLKGAKDGDRVIVRITEWNTGNKNPLGEVEEVLTAEKGADYDMKLLLIQNGFSLDFPQEVYRELTRWDGTIPEAELKKRLDYRNVLTFTIDPEDAKDFDDALSFQHLANGNIEVGVHIADVSYYVHEGSALDKEAERRATSVYLPDRVCPMLPEKLSNELCSLRPDEDKLTYAVIFEWDKNFTLKNQTIARTVIRSNHRFTYDQAQQVLVSGQGHCAEELKTLHQIADRLRQERQKNGAIAFEKEEVKFRLDESGKPVGVYLKVRHEAHLLIEDWMLLANETVAKFGAKLGEKKPPLPFVYRIHDHPEPERLAQFAAIAARFGYQLHFDDNTDVAAAINALLKKVENRPEQHVIETLAIRSMAKAAYTTKNIGHYGLAMKFYTHFTSPIRRYPDVLVHRLLTHLLTHSDKIVSREELETRCRNASLMERRAMEAERDATKYKQIEYLEDKIGEQFDGIISGVILKGIFVELSANKCEGMVSVDLLGDESFTYDERMMRLTGRSSKRRFEIGGKVRVKVLSADKTTRRIDFALIS